MNQRKYCVYMHKNKITGKVYIGVTCLKPNSRWANGKGYIGNKKFYQDIIDIGWDNFEHIILQNDLDKETSKQMEIYYVNQYKDNCYNRTKGGEQGKTKYDTQEEYLDSERKSSKKYYDNHPEYRENKIKKILIKQKANKKEIAENQKDYYNRCEKYRQYKIEYQRKYRREHRKEINEYQKEYNKKHKLTE